MTTPTAALPETVTSLVGRAQRDLQNHGQALSDPDSAEAAHAAMQLHRDLADLLPLAKRLMEERDQLAERLQIAREDPITHLDTRWAWTERAEDLLAAGPIAVIFCDLDHFKPINDSYGHAVGDHVLAVTGQRLAAWCAPHGVACRLGGDEFVVALPDAGEDGDVEGRVAKLRGALAEPIRFGRRDLRVGVSTGFARTRDLATPTLSSAMATADAAMLRIKKRGRRGRRWPTPLMLAHLRSAR